MKRYTIILIMLALTMNIGFISQANTINSNNTPLAPITNWPSILCTILPNYKKTIKKAEIPNFSIKIPCNWNANWEQVQFPTGTKTPISYKLSINSGTTNRLTLLFLYLAAGCAEDSCFQNPTLDYTTIGLNYLREKAQDPNIKSWFPSIAHDVHYHKYTYKYESGSFKIKKFFPFSAGQTTLPNPSYPTRVVYVVGQKTNPAALGLLEMDEAVKSIKY